MAPNDEHAGFASSETVAGLFDGRLDRERRRRMIEHMATCSECHAIAAAWQAPSNRGRSVVAFAAIAVTLLGGGIGYTSWAKRDSRRIEILAEAAPPERSFDGRISAFPYRPYKVPTRSIAEPDSFLSDRHARALIRAIDRAHSTKVPVSTTDFRILGVASLMRGDQGRAVKELERAVKTASGREEITAAIQAAKDATLLSDLSVAYVARGKRSGSAGDFVSALDVAMRAWDLQRSAETAWNRAVAFEALRQNDDARAAWRDYLALDFRSQWAAEAQQRLHRVKAPSQSDLWARESAGLETMSSAQIAALAVRFPQQLREAGEGPLLQSWAAAVLDGDAQAAERTLRQLESLAAALQQRSGESLLADVVATIKGTASTRANARALAKAVRDFDEAMALYGGDSGSRARTGLHRAAEALRQRSCPLAYTVTFYAAASRYFENDYDGLARDIARMADLPQRYMSLHARVEWVTGLGQLARGRPDDAILRYERARKIFSRLGETDYEAATHNLLAEAHVYVDDPDAAWRAWGEAVDAVGEVGSSSEREVLVMIRGARMALAENHPAVASVFLNRALKRARADSDRVFVIETMLWQATVARHRNDGREYQRLIALAQSSAEKIPDPKLRERELNSVRVTRALCGDRTLAAQELDESLAFLRTSSNRFALPQLLYLRGKLAGAGADYQRAIRSYADGLDEIIGQRQATRSPQYDTLGRQHLDEITDSAIALAIARGDYPNAFRISEASAGADLAWRGGTNNTTIPRGVALVKLLTLPDRLVVWMLTEKEARVAQRRVDRGRVRDAVAALESGSNSASGAMLGRLVFDPFAASLAGVSSIVFVPDAVFANAAFEALLDPRTGRNLRNDFAVASAPTVAAFLGTASVGTPASSSILLIDASQGGDLPPLPAAAAEIRKLEHLYGAAHVWSDGDRSEGRVEDRLRAAGLIHIAAHGVVNRSNPLLSGIVLGSRRSFLYAHEVAALDLKGQPVVMLSSCLGSSSSSVRGRRGSSMADAFLAAGASVVVAAAGEVDDSDARAFSLLLHEGLRDGLTVGEAVGRAQSSLSRDGARWTGFHIVGNPAVRLNACRERTLGQCLN